MIMKLLKNCTNFFIMAISFSSKVKEFEFNETTFLLNFRLLAIFIA